MGCLKLHKEEKNTPMRVVGRNGMCVGGIDSINRSFDYDPLYRLMQADGRENSPSTPFPWWDDTYRSTDNTITTAYTQHYDYDKLGNIQKLQHIGNSNFTRNFSYNSMNNMLDNIVIGSNTYSYTYDACGNQLSENTNRHFEWSFSNDMRCFYNQAGTAEPTIYAQYLYDSGGNRIKKIVRTQGGSYESTTYIDGAFEYKTDGTDEQTTTHILDSSSRIASIREGAAFSDPTPAVKYNLEDYLGSSMKLLDTNGTLVNAEEYYPFGETSFGSYAKKRYRYSGKERDSESGLYYYGARDYMAYACRFISCDALSDETPWLSPFVGFDDNPINKTDPDGNAAETVEGGPKGKTHRIGRKLVKAVVHGASEKKINRLKDRLEKAIKTWKSDDNFGGRMPLANYNKKGGDSTNSNAGDTITTFDYSSSRDDYNTWGYIITDSKREKAERIAVPGQVKGEQTLQPIYVKGNSLNQPANTPVLFDDNNNIVDPRGNILASVPEGFRGDESIYAPDVLPISTRSSYEKFYEEAIMYNRIVFAQEEIKTVTKSGKIIVTHTPIKASPKGKF